MKEEEWWNGYHTVIQYNLQIQDTEGMVPKDIAENLKECRADAVVINVGGIYAWYQSKITYHHINEYLSQNQHFLQELIECCHGLHIKVIARFDFSKVDDLVYLQHPEWFVKDMEGQPLIFGSKRMGNWSLLMSTCINGGFRNNEFAVKVLEEAIESFELDGVFFNAPQMEICYCENCKRKYRQMYHEELPFNISLWRKDWKVRCTRDNFQRLYDTVKKIRKNVPVIQYYGTYQSNGKGMPENLIEMHKCADMICTEAQDILFAGKDKLPYKWKPTLNMKLGQYVDNRPQPFGIIHSCPGMDWRHTGLPAAEYEFWMSQIPASHGQIWHSLTGYEKTIGDIRMLRTMKRVNEKIALMKPYMENAESIADVVLLWQAKSSELGFVDALMSNQISFDVLGMECITIERLKKYRVVIVPGMLPIDCKLSGMLKAYTDEGGNLLIEKTDTSNMEDYAALLGISSQVETGSNLSACYGVWEDKGRKIRTELEDTQYFPLRDDILYVKPDSITDIFMTFIPPFAPADGVGAPPERASIPVKGTDIPLITQKKIGKGKVLGVYFSISGMSFKYGLEDQKLLLQNCINYLCEERPVLITKQIPEGIYVYTYRNKNKVMIHMVNGIGERPLRDNIRCSNLTLQLRIDLLPKVNRIQSILEKTNINWKSEGSYITICIDELKVWDMLVVE